MNVDAQGYGATPKAATGLSAAREAAGAKAEWWNARPGAALRGGEPQENQEDKNGALYFKMES